MALNVYLTAAVCHEVNKAICETYGDMSQKTWEDAEEWQRTSAIEGVKWRRDNLDAPVSAQHEKWAQDKLDDGWCLGPVKDPEKKQHPCLVPFDQLPPEQQLKDATFTAIVRAMCA